MVKLVDSEMNLFVVPKMCLHFSYIIARYNPSFRWQYATDSVIYLLILAFYDHQLLMSFSIKIMCVWSVHLNKL